MCPARSYADFPNSDQARPPRATTVDLALQTVTAIRDLVPLEGAKGPLSILCTFLRLLQVHVKCHAMKCAELLNL